MIPPTQETPRPAPGAPSIALTRRATLDGILHRFGPAVHWMATAAIYLICTSALGLAFAVALAFHAQWRAWTAPIDGLLHWPALGVGGGIAFFIGGFALLVTVALFNAVLPTRATPYRGSYFSLASLPWCLHNALFYLARYTFLPFVTLTPIGPWFLRAMGMRIGRRAFINTELISDPCLIAIGDDAVVGGAVHLFAHYGGGGHLTIAPVVIGDRATIGQGATVMGDVVVGPDATLLPHSVLLPGSRVGAGETWGGVPARPLSERARRHLKQLREHAAAPAPTGP